MKDYGATHNKEMAIINIYSQLLFIQQQNSEQTCLLSEEYDFFVFC